MQKISKLTKVKTFLKQKVYIKNPFCKLFMSSGILEIIFATYKHTHTHTHTHIHTQTHSHSHTHLHTHTKQGIIC